MVIVVEEVLTGQVPRLKTPKIQYLKYNTDPQHQSTAIFVGSSPRNSPVTLICGSSHTADRVCQHRYEVVNCILVSRVHMIRPS